MIEAMSQTVADVIGRIGIISIWKTHPRRSPINGKSPILTILTTSENQALVCIPVKEVGPTNSVVDGVRSAGSGL